MVDSYGERLAEALKARGVSTADFARRMKLSYQAVKKVLDGGRFGTANHLKAVQALSVRSEWLADGTGPMDAPQQASFAPDEFTFVRRADVAFSNGVGQGGVPRRRETAARVPT